MLPNTVDGAVTGTGAAINIEIGFIPDHVTLLNQTTGRTLSWYRTMPAGSGSVAGAIVATGGVSPYDGKPNNGFGFTIGTDAVNAAGQVIAYRAERSGPGAK
jgi:hypothetical protein